ncbi:MAG: hypothetical protein LQ345_002968 [Seirophora villosa]|nr:MAG: hypothetical protein LQ345_002968 [Seirophora villosa]
MLISDSSPTEAAFMFFFPDLNPQGRLRAATRCPCHVGLKDSAWKKLEGDMGSSTKENFRVKAALDFSPRSKVMPEDPLTQGATLSILRSADIQLALTNGALNPPLSSLPLLARVSLEAGEQVVGRYHAYKYYEGTTRQRAALRYGAYTVTALAIRRQRPLLEINDEAARISGNMSGEDKSRHEHTIVYLSPQTRRTWGK